MNNKKYSIIYADPPWDYGSKVYSRGEQIDLKKFYKTMKVEDICKLKVKDITTKNAVLFLWVTDSHLKAAFDVIQSWGFTYKTIAFIWIKKTSKNNIYYNVAPWTLKSHEICLFATKGKVSKFKKSNNVKGLIESVRGRHSEKPNEARKRIIELFGDVPRIELFAREKKEGFDVWGDEVECDIEL